MAPGITAFYGDFLGANQNKELKNITLQYHDSNIVFSDMLNKINRRFKVILILYLL